MINPWENIDLAIYEKHMNQDVTRQLPLLNKIMKSQIKYNVDSIAIWE